MSPSRQLAVLALTALASLSLSAAAPKPAANPAIDDPEARIVGALVDQVVVRSGGPAWWTISQGGRTVHVLGVLWNYPPDKRWSHRGLDRRLRTAGVVLLPAVLGEMPKGVVDDSLPQGDWASVPEPVRVRITAAAKRMGKPLERYTTRPPLVAGYLLVSDFRAGMGLKSEVLVTDVAQSAAKAGGELRTAAVLPAERYTKALASATSDASAACLETALAEVEGGEAPMREAVDGWASGDVAQALEAPRGLELCGFAVPGQADLRRAAIDAQVAAIASALDNSGRAGRPASQYIAVANLRTLLAQDGVLDKLRKRGYRITAPQD